MTPGGTPSAHTEAPRRPVRQDAPGDRTRPAAGHCLRCRVREGAAVDVGVAERRRARGLYGRRCGGEVGTEHVDGCAVGGVSHVVVDGDGPAVGGIDRVVVAEELGGEPVLAGATGVTGRASEEVAEASERARRGRRGGPRPASGVAAERRRLPRLQGVVVVEVHVTAVRRDRHGREVRTIGPAGAAFTVSLQDSTRRWADGHHRLLVRPAAVSRRRRAGAPGEHDRVGRALAGGGAVGDLERGRCRCGRRRRRRTERPWTGSSWPTVDELRRLRTLEGLAAVERAVEDSCAGRPFRPPDRPAKDVDDPMAIGPDGAALATAACRSPGCCSRRG